MRVLLVPDRVGPLPPAAVADALAAGWADGAPGDALDVAPLSDGGPGLVGAVARAVPGAQVVPAVVAGTTVEVVRVPGRETRGAGAGGVGGCVVVEVAQVLGERPGVAPGSQAPTSPAPTSLPAAALLEAAIAVARESGAGRLVVGVGGLLSHDAGLGALAGLVAALRGPAQTGAERTDAAQAEAPQTGAAQTGAERTDADLDDDRAWPALRAGGHALADLVPADVAGLAVALDRAATRLAGLELVVAVDSEVPLLGMHGASALLAVPGATVLSAEPTQAQRLEAAFGHAVHVLGAELGPGRVRAAATAHGAGAGGGLAFALGLLGGVLRPAPHVLAELADLAGRAAAADLVVTAATRLDPHSGHDSVLEACALAAAPHAVPVVMITGDALLGRREWVEQGLAGVYPLDDGPGAARVPTDPDGLGAALRARATRVARTWSR